MGDWWQNLTLFVGMFDTDVDPGLGSPWVHFDIEVHASIIIVLDLKIWEKFKSNIPVCFAFAIFFYLLDPST